MTLYIEVIPQRKAKTPKAKKRVAEKAPVLIETVPAAKKSRKRKKSRKS